MERDMRIHGKIRQYREGPKGDAAAADRLLFSSGQTHDIDLDADLVGVAESVDGKELDGLIVARPLVLVHELVIRQQAMMRMIVERLVQYGLGYLRAKDHREVIFLVDPRNEAMQAYLEGLGASREDGAVVYIMPIQ
jgi:hypothetical protein